jgi:GTP-binding protein
MFVDSVQIEVIAGNGGDGCLSFRRERFVPRGGPNGGDGGHGGNVIIVAQEGVDTLAPLVRRKQWKAESGGHGSGANRHGRSGSDVIIPVAPGTVIIDAKRDFVLKDLVEIDDQVVAARGGKGGRGNTHFKSATNQVPRQRSLGESGEQRKLILELKSIADVGLIGKPNAGKSTLLSRLSRARPQIANYPFTTRRPNLGIVTVDSDRQFVMADIPGLIEGAHAGIGLGHEFLRHIERAGILVHLIEPEPQDGSQPEENYRLIRNELLQYNPLLGERPEIIVITKAELGSAQNLQNQLQGQLNTPVLLVSAVTGQGLNDLTRAITAQLGQGLK